MKLNERAQKILCGLASENDFEDLPTADLLAIKGDQSEMHYRFVSTPPQVTRAAGDKEAKPAFKHIASDESVDGMGDIILVDGWELTRFEKNPQLLWAHDQRGLPIGTVTRIWRGRADRQKALLSESSLHGEDMNPQAPLVQRMIEAGALPGVSVGFIPKEMVFPDSEKEREKMGLGVFGVLHKSQELMELSVVPVPANGNALQRKMLERSDAIFKAAAEDGWDADLIEHVRVALCMTDDEQRQCRRRTILVPDIEAAMATVLKSMEEPMPEEVLQITGNVPAEELHPSTIRALWMGDTALDTNTVAFKTVDALGRATEAIERAAGRIEAFTEHLTTRSADAAAGDDKSTDAPTDPAGGSEDFMADVLAGALDQIKS